MARNARTLRLDSGVIAHQLHPIRRTVALKVIQRRGQSSSEYRLRFDPERQIEQARLLFPRSVDVELAEGLALAFRGDRRQVEWHVDRLKSMDLLSARDREFQEKFLLLLTGISETVLSFDFESNTNSVSDLVTDIVELKQALSTLEVAHTL